MSTFDDINAFGNATDTTWGRSSTTEGATSSIKMKLISDSTAMAIYTTVITVAGNFNQNNRDYNYDVAEKALDAYVKNVKKSYKESSGKNVQMTIKDIQQSINPIDLNAFSSLQTVRTCYYQCHALVDIKFS